MQFESLQDVHLWVGCWYQQRAWHSLTGYLVTARELYLVVRRLHWRAGLLVRRVIFGRCIELCTVITACSNRSEEIPDVHWRTCNECRASCAADKSKVSGVRTFSQVAGPGYPAAHGNQLVLELIPWSSLISPLSLPRHAQLALQAAGVAAITLPAHLE